MSVARDESEILNGFFLGTRRYDHDGKKKETTKCQRFSWTAAFSG